MENKYDFLGTDLKDTSILKLSEENNVDEEEENSNLSTIKTRRNKYDFRDDNPTINIYDYIEQSTVTDNKSITPEPDFMTEELALQLAPPPPTDEEINKPTINIVTGDTMSPVGSDETFQKVETKSIAPKEEDNKEYIFEWNRDLKALRDEKEEAYIKFGGKEKYKEHMEAREVEIKQKWREESAKGTYGFYPKYLNKATFGYGSDLLFDTIAGLQYFMTGLDVRTTDLAEAVINGYEKTDEFFGGNFLSIPYVLDLGDIIEGATGNFIYKTRGKDVDIKLPFGLDLSTTLPDYTKKLDKSPEEKADKFMDMVKEFIQLGEVGLVPLAARPRLRDMTGADKISLFPNVNAEKKFKKMIVRDINAMELAVNNAAKIKNNARNSSIFTTSEYDFNVYAMNRATSEVKEKLDADIAKTASENTGISKQIIEDFEGNLKINEGKSRTDKDFVMLSYIDDEGNLQLDFDKARRLGREILKEDQTEKYIQGTKEFLSDPFANPSNPIGYIKGILPENMGGISDLDRLMGELSTDIFSMSSPILNPDKFNSIVALAANLQKKFPELFPKEKTVLIDGQPVKKKMTVIDNLLEVAVNKNIDATELIDDLDKVGMSFEDFVLTVVGSGSQAGKILQKLSMVKRARSTDEIIGLQDKNATMKQQFSFYRGIRRFENARRGGLVSQLTTASRNLSSFFIKAPLETFGNVIDTALFNATKPLADAEGGVQLGTAALLAPVRAGISLVDFNNWKGSSRHIKLLFEDEVIIDPIDKLMFGKTKPVAIPIPEGVPFLSKYLKGEFGKSEIPIMGSISVPVGPTTKIQQVVDSFLKNPEFTEKHSRLFNNLNDIQSLAGRKEIKGILAKLKNPVGSMLNEYEDFIYALNFFNRWQEHMIRRTALFGELERLTKREWNIDFLPALNRGDSRKIINDSSEYKPKNARSFIEIMEDATQKALDMSYSESPDLTISKFIESTIVKSFGTTFAPFPRFMLSQMELLATHAAGALVPLTKHTAHLMYIDRLLPITDKKLMAKGFRSFRDFSTDDRERISRNLVGVAALYGAYEMLKDEEDENGNIEGITKIKIGDNNHVARLIWAKDKIKGKLADVTTNHPLVPLRWAANIYRLMETAFDPSKDIVWNLRNSAWNEPIAEYFDSGGAKETVKVLGGTNFRVGAGYNLLERVSDFITGTGDATDILRIKKFASRIVGSYIGSIFVPMNQGQEVERGFGIRTKNIVDKSVEQSLDSSIVGSNEFYNRAGRSLLTAEEENKLPRKEFIYERIDKPFSRDYNLWKFAAISLVDEFSEAGQYLTRIGLDEFNLTSFEQSKTAKNFEKKMLKKFLPDLVSILKDVKELEYEQEYDSLDTFVKSGVIGGRGKVTKRDYVNKRLRIHAKKMVKAFYNDIIKDEIKRSLDGEAPLKTIMDQLIDEYKGLSKTERDLAEDSWYTTYGMTYNREINYGDPKDLYEFLEMAYKNKIVLKEEDSSIAEALEAYRKRENRKKSEIKETPLRKELKEKFPLKNPSIVKPLY